VTTRAVSAAAPQAEVGSEGCEVVETVDEHFLADLGVRRLAVPVPFAEAGGPVNAYALDNGDATWTLFDTGVGTDEGQRVLDEALLAAGLRLSGLSRIIVSHGHVDHYGNARRLAEASGAQVYAHRDDLAKICGEVNWGALLREHQDFFLGHGVPNETLEALIRGSGHGRVYARQLEASRVALLEDGQVFRFRCFEAEVLHLPGHTPGLVGLHVPAQGLFFSDDHLLERVSPNPVLDFGQGAGTAKFRALSRYVESAGRVYALPLAAVLPGHGPAFRGHRALLDGLLGFYRKRQEKLLRRLEVGPATLFELLVAIFPRWDLPRLYLMLSEVLGNLEVLEDEGRVAREGEAPRRFVARSAQAAPRG
jgi:glyoxylase-like metal-dependent hydrolase (beta-lactamase superfamily II)